MQIRNVLEKYIEGKDDNKFEILENIYLETAKLMFKIESNSISFPSNINGNKEIAKVLSKDFNEKFDNVKTYYLSNNFPNKKEFKISKQKWLVLMREKENENIRVGCGYYDWCFNEQVNGELKVVNHTIYIHEMLSLSDASLNYLLNIQKNLLYPWADKNKLIEVLNEFKELKVITNYLATN